MEKVLGVRFKKTGKLSYIYPLQYEFKVGDLLIANSERGMEIGRVVSILEEEELKNKIKNVRIEKVIRPISTQDFKKDKFNQEDAKKALIKSREFAKKHKLDMKLVHSEYLFDRSKLIFYFVSEERVDFRELVKDLAYEYKVRIEVRQIGPRDELKIHPSIGVCGREVCCRSFLKDFESVTIKMAKQQGLQINMPKLSGNCGRLMCCLKYEEDMYAERLKKFPKINSKVKYNNEDAKVVFQEVLKDKVKIKIGKAGEERFETVDISEIKF